MGAHDVCALIRCVCRSCIHHPFFICTIIIIPTENSRSVCRFFSLARAKMHFASCSSIKSNPLEVCFACHWVSLWVCNMCAHTHTRHMWVNDYGVFIWEFSVLFCFGPIRMKKRRKVLITFDVSICQNASQSGTICFAASAIFAFFGRIYVSIVPFFGSSLI